MPNLYKPVSLILRDTPPISAFLKNASHYYAHIRQGEDPETLQAHIELVQDKFKLLVEYHHLDVVIDELIERYVRANFRQNPALQKQLGNFIKRLFVNTVVFHDYGKVNENFQADVTKMNNPHFKGKERPESPLSTHHSGLGAYLFIVKHWEEMDQLTANNDKAFTCLSWCVLSFSYTIFRHHSKYLFDDLDKKVSFDAQKVEAMKGYIKQYGFELDAYFTEKLPLDLGNFFEFIEQAAEEKSITKTLSIYSLVRLSFSLLTASDFLASGEYMSDLVLKDAHDFGVLSRQRVRDIYYNAYHTQNYNQRTFEAIDRNEVLDLPTQQGNQHLNQLRQKMAMEVVKNVRQHSSERLFYIEAPTGGGKTNLSMLAVAELLHTHPELNKVFYVFPFTTLITQTYQAIKTTLGLADDEIIELHSRAGFKAGDKKEEKTDEDGKFGDEKKHYIDNLFVNFPFCLLSHIKFFDLLKTNRKDMNYLMHRLANSVVVIDELQSYNPKHWDKVIFLIRYYAQTFNMRFVLMSATLPKLGGLSVLTDQVKDVVDLLPEARERYFQNVNFAKRVSFDFSLLQKLQLPLPDLVDHLFAQSAAYAPADFGKAKPAGSVYTIIEFIFKKTAAEFYEVVKQRQKQAPFFDEVFVLSGTILSHRRKYIINYLKNPENRQKKILLISTQVVEAGVDIDMDVGYKNRSLVDSDEQLAGRINRNVDKQGCRLFLFQYNEPNVIYGEDRRYKITQEKLRFAQYKQMLTSKNFDHLYGLVMDDINALNASQQITPEQKLSTYTSKMENLQFGKAHFDFRLINQANLSVFVPMPIPVQVAGAAPGTQEEVFSAKELDFLAKAGIAPNAAAKIEGAQVFALYARLINNRGGDFIKAMVNIRVLKGIMAKFVFSVFDDDKHKTRKKLVEYADIEQYKQQWKDDDQEEKETVFGFIYLAHYSQIYDEEAGLIDTAFDNSDNKIL